MFGLGFWEILIILIILLISYVPLIFFILTLRKAVLGCHVDNRKISPDSIWLLLIPIFNLIWMFFVVINIAQTLGDELIAKGVETQSPPTKSIGLAMCILNVCSIIPLLGTLCGLVGFVLWIVYWVQVANISSQLRTTVK